MITPFSKNTHKSFKIAHILTTGLFLLNVCIFPSMSLAQSVLNLPSPGGVITASPAYTPAIISGIKIYPDDPLQFDFIIDTGDDNLQGEALRIESKKMINYFLASLTIPEEEMWVNLSPYEKDRIIPQGLGETEMGRDMLAQDYILKQVASSLMYPEEKLGANFWKKIYAQAELKYGTTDIPTNTFNKVWIVPQKAEIFVHETHIFVSESHLKVFLEEDYLAMENNAGRTNHGLGNVHPDDLYSMKEDTKKILQEIIIPALEKEVNQGKNFANLRQIYNAMILATWYKKNLKESLLGRIYLDANKIDGIALQDKEIKNKIYNQYVEAFKKGVYNYIKEDYDTDTQQIIPRKYFSGGVTAFKAENIFETDGVISKSWMTRQQDRYAQGIPLISENVPLAPLQDTEDEGNSQDLAMPSYESVLEKALKLNTLSTLNALSLEEAVIVANKIEEDGREAPIPLNVALIVSNATEDNLFVVSLKVLTGLAEVLKETIATAQKSIDREDSMHIFLAATDGFKKNQLAIDQLKILEQTPKIKNLIDGIVLPYTWNQSEGMDSSLLENYISSRDQFIQHVKNRRNLSAMQDAYFGLMAIKKSIARALDNLYEHSTITSSLFLLEDQIKSDIKRILIAIELLKEQEENIEKQQWSLPHADALKLAHRLNSLKNFDTPEVLPEEAALVVVNQLETDENASIPFIAALAATGIIENRPHVLSLIVLKRLEHKLELTARVAKNTITFNASKVVFLRATEGVAKIREAIKKRQNSGDFAMASYDTALARFQNFNKLGDLSHLKDGDAISITHAAIIVAQKLEEEKTAPIPLNVALIIANESEDNIWVASKEVLEAIAQSLNKKVREILRQRTELDPFGDVLPAVTRGLAKIKCAIDKITILESEKSVASLINGMVFPYSEGGIQFNNVKTYETARDHFVLMVKNSKDLPSIETAKSGLWAIKKSIASTMDGDEHDLVQLALSALDQQIQIDIERLTLAASWINNEAMKIDQKKDQDDLAMPTKKDRYGGIDFNSNAMSLAEKGQKIHFQMDHAAVSKPVNGMQPVIMNITPVSNFLSLIGK